VQQPSEQRALAVVDAAAGDEPKQRSSIRRVGTLPRIVGSDARQDRDQK
jgi:hypothetical protein